LKGAMKKYKIERLMSKMGKLDKKLCGYKYHSQEWEETYRKVLELGKEIDKERWREKKK